MSDRIVVMNNGRVEQEGAAEEIFEQPRTRFVAGFMGAANILDADIVGRDGSSARLRIARREMTLPSAIPGNARTAAVVVRPEKVRMDVTDGWVGTVTERVYKGTTMSYRIRLDDGTEVNAEVAHDDPAHRHEVGDDMTIAFRPDDIVVIPDDGKRA